MFTRNKQANNELPTRDEFLNHVWSKANSSMLSESDKIAYLKLYLTVNNFKEEVAKEGPVVIDLSVDNGDLENLFAMKKHKSA